MGYRDSGYNDEFDNSDARAREAYWRRWNRWKWRPRDYLYMVVVVVGIIAASVGLRRCFGGRGATGLPAGARAVTTATPLAVGSDVIIEWKGSWYEGVVRSIGRTTVRVHYTGWDDRWDEDVTRDRLRVP